MKCERVRKLVIEGWGADELLSPAIRDHLAACGGCAEESLRIAEALGPLSASEIPDPGPEYWRGFLPRVKARAAAATAPSRPHLLRRFGMDLLPVRLAAAAAAFIALLGVAGFWAGWFGRATDASIESRLDEEIEAAGRAGALQVDDMLAGDPADVSLDEPELDSDALMAAVGEVMASLSHGPLRGWESVDRLIEELSEDETKALLEELKPTGEEPAVEAVEENTG